MGLTRQQKVTIAVLLSGTLLVVLNATFLSPALPHIMRDTGVDATTVQWLTSAYMLVEAVLIPLNAFFVGRVSTRRLFIGGMTWFGIAAVVAAVAPNFYVILLGRIMMAMATGIIMPMVFTLIVLIFPRERRGSAMGTIGLIISFAPAIGPSLSGVLVDNVGWRMLFVIVAVLAAIVVVVALPSLKSSTFDRVPFDAPSVSLLLVGMVALLYGISSSTSAANRAVPLALIAVGLVLLAFFVRRQGRLDTPVLRISVLKSRKFRTAVVLMALLQASLVGSEVVLPLYVQQVMGYPATVSGILMFPGAVIGALCGFFAGRLFDRHGVRGLAIFGSIVLGIGAIGVSQFSMTMPIVLVTVFYTTMGIGIQFMATPLNTWGVNSLDNRVIQHANALSGTMNQVGASLGTAFIVSLTALGPLFVPQGTGEVETTFSGVHIAFVGMSIMVLVVVVGILVFVRDTKADKQAATEQAAQAPDAASTAAPQAVAGTPGVDRTWLVCDVMNPTPDYVHESASTREVIDILRRKETSGVPVVNDAHEVVGFVADGDVLNYLANQGVAYPLHGYSLFSVVEDEDFWERLRELDGLNVMRIATRQVVAMDAEDEAEAAFKTLAEQRIKKVPVVKDGKLVGSLSRRNIINALQVLEETLATDLARKGEPEDGS